MLIIGPFADAIMALLTFASFGITNKAKTIAKTASPIHPRLWDELESDLSQLNSSKAGES